MKQIFLKQKKKPFAAYPLVLLLFLFSSQSLLSTDYYVSPTGSGGSFTKAAPGSVADALALTAPGDFIRLLPGAYKQITVTKSGLPEKPITIISDANTPANYALIDMGAKHDYPANSGPVGYEGVIVSGQSWIVIENSRIQNCWQNLILLDYCSYITVRGCYGQGAHSLVSGPGAHHVLLENNSWVGNPKIWTTWSWDEVHSDYYGHNNIFMSNLDGGAGVFRNNTISYVYNAFQMWGDVNDLNKWSNMEIYGNRVSHVVDNTLEPETHTMNLHFYHNIINNNSHYIFSMIQGTGASSGPGNNDAHGPVYVYGNVGYYDFSDVPGGTSTSAPTFQVMKYFQWFNPSTPLTFVHNTFYYGGWAGKNANDHSIIHKNNISVAIGAAISPVRQIQRWFIWTQIKILQQRLPR